MTYGTATFDKGQWKITAPPYVRAKLKNVFRSMKNQRDEVLTLAHNNGNARELEWFFVRYPMAISAAHSFVLKMAAAASREIESETLAIREGLVVLPPVPLALPLRDYQRIAVDMVRTTGALLCGDDLGLGKTVVGIAVAAEKHPAVVVCPVHLQRQWMRQITTFAPELRVQIAKLGTAYHLENCDVFILNYDKLKGWRHYLAKWARAIIFDEGHELRHSTSQKYDAAREICQNVETKLALTATPVFNYGGEIFNIIDLLSPGALGEIDEFMTEWCAYGATAGKMIVNDPPALGAFLRDNGLMIRRTRRDVGKELKPLVKIAHEVGFNKDIMDKLKSEALQLARTILAEKGDFNEKGIASRQLDLKLRQATGIAKAPFAAEFVADLVEKGESVLVTCWHREVIDVLQTTFAARGIPCSLFSGTESANQKDASARAFLEAKGPAVMIMSIRSGAGLDGLQMKCSTIVHVELDWTPQIHNQADGRLNRDGQTENVTAIYLVTDGGSDPIIAGLLGVKYEQGVGITDPELKDENRFVAASTFDAQADQHRVAALARDVLRRFAA